MSSDHPKRETGNAIVARDNQANEKVEEQCTAGCSTADHYIYNESDNHIDLKQRRVYDLSETYDDEFNDHNDERHDNDDIDNCNDLYRLEHSEKEQIVPNRQTNENGKDDECDDEQNTCCNEHNAICNEQDAYYNEQDNNNNNEQHTFYDENQAYCDANFNGNAYCYNGSDQCYYYNGNDQCYNGNDQCYNGSDQCYNGNGQCYNGNDPCYNGNDPCYNGNDPCYNGNDPCYDGNDQCYDGNDQCYNVNDQCSSDNGNYYTDNDHVDYPNNDEYGQQQHYGYCTSDEYKRHHYKQACHENDGGKFTSEQCPKTENKDRIYSRRRWLALVGCMLVTIPLVVVASLVVWNDSTESKNSPKDTTEVLERNSGSRRPVSSNVKTRSPVVLATTKPTPVPVTLAPSPSPIETVTSTAFLRLDFIGGTDLLNEFSTGTLEESFVLFLEDHFDAEKITCVVGANELVEGGRELKQQLRHLGKSALRVDIESTAEIDKTKNIVFDTDSLTQLIQDNQFANDFLTILSNARDGAYESVSKIAPSDNMLWKSSNTSPAPTPITSVSVDSSAPSSPIVVNVFKITPAPSISASDETLSPTPANRAVLPVEVDSSSNETVSPQIPSPSPGPGNSTMLPTIMATGGAVITPEIPTVTIAPTETIDVRSIIREIMGSTKFTLEGTDPYSKALDWIVEVDPMKMPATSPNLMQRFIAAYMYFATSTTREWTSCGPAADATDNVVNCTYKKVVDMNPVLVEESPATRWLSSVGECHWVGVDCDHTAQIQTIQLVGMNMTGYFPEGLALLPKLKNLILTIGELQGTIPSGILTQMTSLANIDLQHNKLTGTFPNDGLASRGTSMEGIYLSSNNLTGSLSESIGKLLNLKGLLLSKNGMTGQLPTSLGLLTNLEYIRLSDNKFRGSIPSTVGYLFKLTDISFQQNALTGSIPSSLSLMMALTELKLYENELTGTIPDALYSITSLSRFEVHSNVLSGTINTKIGQLTNIMSLRLSSNGFVGTLPTELNQLTSLKYGWFYRNNFNGTLSIRPVQSGAELISDCTVDSMTNAVEISCPFCTKCCDSTGQSCQVM